MGNFVRNLLTVCIAQGAKASYINDKKRELKKMEKRMNKYIHTPADQMTTEQILEDYKNWGFGVHVVPSGYIIQKNGVTVFKANNEKELHDNYEAVFSYVKIV